MKKLTAFMAGNLLVLSGVHVAQAQSVSGLQLEEVIVTAEKREADLQKTAMSIQVYKGEELQKQGKKRIDEIMNGVVGVQSQDSQVGKTFYMRGVDGGSSSGAPATGAGQTVAVLIDGVYQSRTETIRGGTLDVAQVEVMRGTQSSNVGTSALAGAVSLVTNKPVFDYQASGSLEVGNYHLVNTEGVLNVPLTDNQAIRLAYSTNKRDGFFSSGAGDTDILNARAKYRWQVNDDLDIVLTAAHQKIGGNGVTQGVLTYTGRWVPYSAATFAANGYLGCSAMSTAVNRGCVMMGYPPMFGLVATPGETFRDRDNPWDDGYPKNIWPNNPYRDTKIEDFNGEINWNLGVATLTVLPSYEQAHFQSEEAPRGSGTSWMGENRLQNTKQIEARLVSKEGGALSWLAGAYYYDSKFSGTMLSVAFPNDSMNVGGTTVSNNSCGFTTGEMDTCTTWTRDNLNGTTTKAVYGDLTFSATDALRLKGGLRYAQDTKVAEYSVGPATTSSNPLDPTAGSYVGGWSGPVYEQWGSGMSASDLRPFTGFKYRRIDHTWSNLAYSVGIDYDLLPEVMVYTAYKTGYLAGSLNTMGTSPLYTPENTSDQITLGFKSRWFDNTLQLNVEAFSMKFKDRVFGNNGNLLNVGVTCTTAAGAGSPYVAADYSCLNPNVPMTVDQSSQGVDVEVNFVPTNADRLDLTLEYLDAHYVGKPNAPAFTVAQINAAAATSGATASNDAAATNLLALYNARLNSYDNLLLQNAPKYSGNVSYSHEFELGNSGKLTPNISMSYKDAYWSQGGAGTSGVVNPDGTPFSPNHAMDKGSWVRQDAYTVWNANLGWESADGKFNINGYVKNIANEVIQTNLGGEPGSPVPYVSLDNPRTYGVVFGASF